MLYKKNSHEKIRIDAKSIVIRLQVLADINRIFKYKG